MKKNTIAERMSRFRTLIFNAKDPEVLAILDEVGIDEPYIDAGILLFNETDARIKRQAEDHQGLDLAYDRYILFREELRERFNKRLKMIKTLSRKAKTCRIVLS